MLRCLHARRSGLASSSSSRLLTRGALIFVRDVKISAIDLRAGALVRGDEVGAPKERFLRVDAFTRGKAGKGGGFLQVTMRDIQNGTTYQHKFGSADKVELVNLDKTLQYSLLYQDDGVMHLMEDETFDQIEVPLTMIDPSVVKWLQDGMTFRVQCYEGSPMLVHPPEKAVVEVTEASTNLQGDTLKWVKVDNGERLRVPTHIKAGQRIMVNVVDGTFYSRAAADE